MACSLNNKEMVLAHAVRSGGLCPPYCAASTIGLDNAHITAPGFGIKGILFRLMWPRVQQL
jgi:hypothetical protein